MTAREVKPGLTVAKIEVSKDMRKLAIVYASITTPDDIFPFLLRRCSCCVFQGSVFSIVQVSIVCFRLGSF
jgi:hypothetical protein